MTKKKKPKALAKIRKEAIATTIKGVTGKVLMIRSLKKPGMNEKGNDLTTEVDTRIIMFYLTLKIGFLPLKGTRRTLGGLILLRLLITSETRISSASTIMRRGT